MAHFHCLKHPPWTLGSKPPVNFKSILHDICLNIGWRVRYEYAGVREGSQRIHSVWATLEGVVPDTRVYEGLTKVEAGQRAAAELLDRLFDSEKLAEQILATSSVTILRELCRSHGLSDPTYEYENVPVKGQFINTCHCTFIDHHGQTQVITDSARFKPPAKLGAARNALEFFCRQIA